MRSGAYCRCKKCGWVGYAYGSFTGFFVTSPWCGRCGRNNALEEVERELPANR